ncbi:MAG: DUF3298 and DUF4163 domain-containing protein [Butyrivibrio sp.]|nr:DUF3298 and DUF4163 domain-containing protein [Butyrivibrio sp.]
MKQKLILCLIMIFVCALLCLGMVFSKQDNVSAATCWSGNLSTVISSTVQVDKISDIVSNSISQDTDNIQDDSIIEYANHTTVTSPVAVILYSEKRSMEAVHDRIIYTSMCTYPVVTIEGNVKAADKINADIQARVDDFRSDDSYLEQAKEEYEEWYNTNSWTYTYSDNMLFSVARADSNVISFLVTYEWYGGGAHGLYGSTGLNYDARTGELVDFANLSDNADAFRQDTLAFHQNLAATDSYKNIMIPDGYDLEEILYQDGRWYLSTFGLVFFTHPYELGAFSAGEIEFAIPYADLKEMGFQEKYAYDGPETIILQTEEACLFDLDGDGQDEEIQFYIEKPGSATTPLHFIINGIDYALSHDELASQFSNNKYIFCWTKCFLYDMDEEDGTMEIAFQMNMDDWDEDEMMPTTFFYRYEKDGSLAYLGEAKTAVTDPTAVFDFMPEYDIIIEGRIVYPG